MKKSLCIIAILVVLLLFSCASRLDFMPTADTKLDNFVESTNIQDYEKIIKKNKIKTVFYTDEYFVVQVDSVFHVLKSRGYKNFHDYKEGKLKNPEEWSIFKPGYSLKR